MKLLWALIIPAIAVSVVPTTPQLLIQGGKVIIGGGKVVIKQ